MACGLPDYWRSQVVQLTSGGVKPSPWIVYGNQGITPGDSESPTYFTSPAGYYTYVRHMLVMCDGAGVHKVELRDGGGAKYHEWYFNGELNLYAEPGILPLTDGEKTFGVLIYNQDSITHEFSVVVSGYDEVAV